MPDQLENSRALRIERLRDLRRERLLRDRRDRPQPRRLAREGARAVPRGQGGRRARGQAAEARQPRASTRATLYDKPYDNENSFGATYGEHREASSSARDEYAELQAYARELGVDFFSTAFDHAERRLPRRARHAGLQDRLRRPQEHAAAASTSPQFGKPMIISTGGATLEDVQRAYDAIMPINPQLAILQCTAGYPAAFEELDLRVIATYRERFPGRGRRLLQPRQRHRDAGRRLHARRAHRREALHAQPRDEGHRPRASRSSRSGLRKMVRDLERTRVALGDGVKKVYESEAGADHQDGQEAGRGARPARPATCSTASDIVMKSPGGGMPPYELDRVLGRTLRQAAARGRRR